MKITGEQYVQAMQTVSEYWMGNLPYIETVIIQFVIQRTLRWGKLEESIPSRHFLEGVRYADGTLAQTGIDTRKSTLRKACSRLQNKGLLKIRVANNGDFSGNKYSIYVNKLLKKGKVMKKSKLKEPKKQNKVPKKAEIGVECGNRGGGMREQGG